MFEAAEAVMRPEMVMGEWRLGSGGLEAVIQNPIHTSLARF